MSTAEDVRIGDFSKPIAPASPTKEALESAEKQLDADAAKDEAALKPMKSYEERLKEVGVTREEAAEIIDAVLLKGYFAKEYNITKRIKVKFRTRSARDTERAQDMLEASPLTMATHYNDKLARYLLAASLEYFGTEKLEHSKRGDSKDAIEASYAARLNYVENMSDPALRVLFDKLRVFDTMIATVLAEGTIENF